MKQKLSSLEIAGVLLVTASLSGAWLSLELGFQFGVYASLATFLIGDALYLIGAARRRSGQRRGA